MSSVEKAAAVFEQLLDRLNDNDNVADKTMMNGFLKALVPQILTDESLILSTDNEWALMYINENYKKAMNEEISAILGNKSEVIVVLSPTMSSQKPVVENIPAVDNTKVSASDFHTSINTPENGDIADNSQRSRSQKPAGGEVFPTFHNSDEKPVSQTSRPRGKASESTKTFDNFVVASTNSTAYQTAFSVAENPGTLINPLFIYGRSGLGKTHLLLAIKDYVNKNYPDMRVYYSPVTSLKEDFVQALGTQDWRDFNSKYKMADVLLLDDVQYLEGAEETTNEFFKIFNEMVDNKRQIVLSADRSPKDMNLDVRITSRFLSGVLADIQVPQFETKLKIFRNHLDELKKIHGNTSLEIPNEVVDRVVELSNSNIRNLEGAAASLIVYISYGREDKTGPITVEEAEEVVSKIFFTNLNEKITISDIQSNVEKYYKVTHGELLGSQRPRHISLARQVGMYLSRVLTQASYPEIGKAFKKDHSSVVHAYKNIENRRQKDRDFAAEIDRISDMITASEDVDLRV